VPSWWSKLVKELKLATFNARAETVAEKPFFREGFKLLSKDEARRIVANIANRTPWSLNKNDGASRA
jgi:putative SOS response-associated peptidase YedK